VPAVWAWQKWVTCGVPGFPLWTFAVNVGKSWSHRRKETEAAGSLLLHSCAVGLSFSLYWTRSCCSGRCRDVEQRGSLCCFMGALRLFRVEEAALLLSCNSMGVYAGSPSRKRFWGHGTRWCGSTASDSTPQNWHETPYWGRLLDYGVP